ncbi:MAG: hypothetical protein IKQ30_09015 [Bacteroidales bacterium]|nr:hypothetical protein [Bacteroidales bacterium]MBR4272962.1 hypothetical protein [Bacteroidales bacterium]
MTIDLSDFDTENNAGVVACLTDELENSDICESQDCPITVQYNQIDLGKTKYNFNQPFEGNEANLYFKRMKKFAGLSVNYIIEHCDYKLHFNRSGIQGNLKKAFDQIDPKIAKANPLIYHFALDPDSKVNNADRKKKIRNPRIYFMVGYNGMIHIIFFDPYHELNPLSK